MRRTLPPSHHVSRPNQSWPWPRLPVSLVPFFLLRSRHPGRRRPAGFVEMAPQTCSPSRACRCPLYIATSHPLLCPSDVRAPRSVLPASTDLSRPPPSPTRPVASPPDYPPAESPRRRHALKGGDRLRRPQQKPAGRLARRAPACLPSRPASPCLAG